MYRDSFMAFAESMSRLANIGACTTEHMKYLEQMIKGEKEMQKKLDNFDMKDIHSGYVVKFRNGKLALCTRVGEKFTKIFACVDDESQMLGAKEEATFVYASRYKLNAYYKYNPYVNCYENHPDFDIVAVYGLIEGVRNYLNVGDTGPIPIKNRPVLWEETKKMTLKEVEEALGYKVEIVDFNTVKVEKPVAIKGTDCKRCVRDCGNSKCSADPDVDDCPGCKRSLSLKMCPCLSINYNEPCPYFEEEK